MLQSPLKAILDACVIFRATLRDTLLRAAEQRIYEVYWSDIILEEASRNLIESGTMSPEQAQRLLAAMRQAFSAATVRDFELLIPAMTNDEKDRHVVAAGVKAGVHIIVTSNRKDYPNQALEPFQIQVKSPDEFLMLLFDKAPEKMVQIVIQQAASLRKPAKTLAEVLDDIAAQAPQFAALVRSELNFFGE